MENAERTRDAILNALRDHPFLSRRQLELYLGRSGRTVRRRVRELIAKQWVWRTNGRQPWMRTRALFALTPAGVAELAGRTGISPADYIARTQLSRDRMNQLVLVMERVFQLRTLFLWLAPSKTERAKGKGKHKGKAGQKQRKQETGVSQEPLQKANLGEWHTIKWDVEVGKLFTAKGNAVLLPFHGAALMQRGDGHWAFVVVEFDLRRVPVERERGRLAQFVAAQDDGRYWGKDKDQFFPVLLVIAADDLRLQDYYNVLRSAALARQLPLPRAYLTTFDAMLSLSEPEGKTKPIWYSTISGKYTSLLSDTEGVATALPAQVPWRKMPLNATGVRRAEAQIIGALAPSAITPEPPVPNQDAPSDAKSTQSAGDMDELARTALTLWPLEKRLLDEIAAHPLLTREELMLLLQASLRRVYPALRKLTKLQLIQPREVRYLLTFKGQHYLALTAGFGNAVRRYARARGWGNGLEVLVRHWEHTKQENAFFLHLAEIARGAGHTLTWFSELESRLYYEAGQRRHSFLPDGRGTFIAGDERYEFALEVDRSRMPEERIRGKLSEYEACVASNVLRSEGIELLRVLVLTNSWERAETWRRAAQAVHAHLPILITTFDRLYASGANTPLWLRADGSRAEEPAAATPKVHCFECFARAKPDESKPRPS